MASFRTALLATAAATLSLAATPGALANGLSFINKTTSDGLGANGVPGGVYASGSSLYAGTNGGLSISADGGSTFFANRTTADGLVYSPGNNS